jgi:hypothetical protein
MPMTFAKLHSTHLQNMQTPPGVFKDALPSTVVRIYIAQRQTKADTKFRNNEKREEDEEFVILYLKSAYTPKII